MIMQAGILYWQMKYKKEKLKKYTEKEPYWGSCVCKGITRHVWDLFCCGAIEKNGTVVPQLQALTAPALPPKFYAGCYNTQSYRMF